MNLDNDMRRLVAAHGLCFAATVCADGTPNLSPKGTTIVWDDEHLAFLDLHSPGTVANLAANPSIEINAVDPLVRKGYRFKGTAVALTAGDTYNAVVGYFIRERGTDPPRIHAVVLMRVDTASPLISPAYDSGATEAQIVTKWRDHYLAVADAHLADPD